MYYVLIFFCGWHVSVIESALGERTNVTLQQLISQSEAQKKSDHAAAKLPKIPSLQNPSGRLMQPAKDSGIGKCSQLLACDLPML